MPKKTSNKLSKEIEALAAENAKLKAENSLLRTDLGHQQHAFGKGWRMVVIALSVAAANAFLIAGNILFWGGDTLINTDKNTKTITEVAQDKAVQAGVAQYTTAQLFQNVDVTGTIQGALPPRASFLAEPLTAEVRKATNQALEHTLAGDKFQSRFAKLNANAHDKLISAIKNSKSDGKINLQAVYAALTQSLRNTKLNFLADKTLPPKVGSIQVINAPWLPKARSIINGIGWIKPVSLLLVAVFSTLAIWLSHNRRKLVIILGSFFGLGMLASLVSFRIVRSVVVAHTAPAYQTAVDHAAHIIVRPLAVQTATILAISLLIVTVAWLSGPYKAAEAVRERLQILFSGKLHQALFGAKEPGFAKWVAAHKRMLQWLAIALIGVVMLLVTLSPALVLKYALLIVIVELIIETLAAPHSKRKR